jgi:YrbI family 3-deoxy-D-manno-octulosonate 8-phosphate phosphatase
VHDKLALVKRLCAQHSITLDEVAYIGDDLMDIPLLEAVGFGCSVSDGMEPAREAASYVTKAKGGEGAVREVAELILASLSR